MRLENGDAAFCNTCPRRGTCVGGLSTEVLPTETGTRGKKYYYSLRLQDKVYGRSADMEPLNSSWFNGMQEQTKHLELAGQILLDRIAACTGQNAVGDCVIVDQRGISGAVLKQLRPQNEG